MARFRSTTMLEKTLNNIAKIFATYFTEHYLGNTDGNIGQRDNNFSHRAVMEDTDLRYSRSLHGIDWESVINMELPITSQYRKNAILHISGQFSINPLLLLSKVIQDQTDIHDYVFKSDSEFRISLKSFANELSRYDQDFDYEMANDEISSSLEYSLRKVYGENDYVLINDFLRICHAIAQKYGLSGRIVPLKHQQHRLKREIEQGIGLELPYSPTECWHLGATHNGALEGVDGIRYVYSAVDMAPSLYHGWNEPFDYFGSSGDVYSAHSGTIWKHSECSIEIIHNQTGYSTYYSHILIRQKTDGEWVEQGELIGRINLDPIDSNCGCDHASRSFECACGPHLHLELRHYGKPETLDKKTISQLLIKTGTYAHDRYCNDPDSCLTATDRNGEPCATTYTNIHNPKDVVCPVVKGANIGKE